MLSLKGADQRGREDGFRRGWRVGYRQGSCESIMNQAALEHVEQRDLHIVYITAGIDVPYPALDQAIMEGFRGMVREITVASPSDNVAELTERLRPDLVLALNGVVFPAEQLIRIREQGVKTAIWFTDDPYYTDWTQSIAPRYDFVFTLESTCVAFYRELGCPQVYHLPFAVNPAVFHPKSVTPSYESDVCFIGTAFWNRVALFDQLAPYLASKKVVISGWWWDRLQSFHSWGNQIQLGRWLSPEETANYYNGAKIVINLHREAVDPSINCNSRKIPAVSVNPRMFEISGCNVLQLCDPRDGMQLVYENGHEISTFTSTEDLIHRLEYYLTHEEERHELALNGLRRTMRDHTYRKRLAQMLAIIF